MIYYASTTAIRHGDGCYFLPPHSHRYIPSFPMPSKNTSAANQRTDSRCVVYNPLIINQVNGIHKLIDYLKDYRILI